MVALSPEPDYVSCLLALTDLRDLAIAISRCRRLLDLDADPVAVGDLLSGDPVLAPLVAKAPGRRVPRAEMNVVSVPDGEVIGAITSGAPSPTLVAPMPKSRS